MGGDDEHDLCCVPHVEAGVAAFLTPSLPVPRAELFTRHRPGPGERGRHGCAAGGPCTPGDRLLCRTTGRGLHRRHHVLARVQERCQTGTELVEVHPPTVSLRRAQGRGPDHERVRSNPWAGSMAPCRHRPWISPCACPSTLPRAGTVVRQPGTSFTISPARLRTYSSPPRSSTNPVSWRLVIPSGRIATTSPSIWVRARTSPSQ